MELVEPVRQRRKEAAIFTGWRMRVSTMRYRKYWKAENRMGEAEKNAGNERKLRAASEAAFEESGCKADCEETYRKFIGLRFTYTWKEIQARNVYPPRSAPG